MSADSNRRPTSRKGIRHTNSVDVRRPNEGASFRQDHAPAIDSPPDEQFAILSLPGRAGMHQGSRPDSASHRFEFKKNSRSSAVSSSAAGRL